MKNTIEEIIKDYYNAWVNNNKERVNLILSDNLIFKSPNEEYTSASQFIDSCWKYATHFKSFNIIEGIYSNQTAYILYKMGNMYIGGLIKTKNNKITEIYVTFNPTI